MTRPKSCGEYAGTHAGVNRHRKAWEPLGSSPGVRLA